MMPKQLKKLEQWKKLKQETWAANLLLPKYQLVKFTWGNVSAIDRNQKIMVIKPSGIDYDKLTPDDMAVVDFCGNHLDGKKPSSDMETHLELYRNFSEIGGIVHTHSRWATIFSQMRRGIPPFGTTHADYFYGEIPCTRVMTPDEIRGAYERNTGRVIVESCQHPEDVPAVLVANHGPFTWGKHAMDAVHHAVILEEVAFMAWHCGTGSFMQQELLDRHYLRKHGKDAYYGQ